MKKILILSVIIGSFFAVQNAIADETELSRSCLRNNPIMEGMTDLELVRIFTAVCDKKNSDKKNGYLIQAAQRFQQIGQNWKALQLVNALQAANVQGNTLTDVKFLAASSITSSAIDDIRNKEMRYLTSDGTYPVAKNLVEKINLAKPASVLIEPAPSRGTQSNRVRSTTQSRAVKSASKPKTVSKATPQTKPTTPKKSSASPFEGL